MSMLEGEGSISAQNVLYAPGIHLEYKTTSTRAVCDREYETEPCKSWTQWSAHIYLFMAILCDAYVTIPDERQEYPALFLLHHNLGTRGGGRNSRRRLLSLAPPTPPGQCIRVTPRRGRKSQKRSRHQCVEAQNMKSFQRNCPTSLQMPPG